MARDVNKAILLGHVGADPEIRATSSGDRLAKVSLATHRTWRDQAGTDREATEWHKLTFFGRLVDVVEEYVEKGDRIYVEGRIEYSTTEKDGQTRYWTDVVVRELVLLGGRSEDDSPEPF